MTRLELFEQLCTLVDGLACQVRRLTPSPEQDALEAMVQRVDALLDAVVTMERTAEDDETPCPPCGEPDCEASCTAALVQHPVEDDARGSASDL